jgi:D-alanyl-D-alanine carboxypeptidase (penicillin-binding protein 5/6)
MMMHKTRELGLSNTNFTNSHGFHDDNHYSCALDIAKLSRELLAIKEITSYTNVYIDCIKKDTNRPLKLVNTNKLVHLYPEVDGLKTGYTPQAKYCLSTTAKKGDHRILVVVMGVTHERIRDIQVTDMLNYAFLHGCKE